MTRWVWGTVILSITSISCSSRFGSGTWDADADSSEWIRVSSSATDIAAAKRLSASQVMHDEVGPLNNPEEIWYVDQATEALLQKNRNAVIPKLIAVIESSGKSHKARARAASLLVRLHNDRGRDALATQLDSPVDDDRVAALRKSPDCTPILQIRSRISPIYLSTRRSHPFFSSS